MKVDELVLKLHVLERKVLPVLKKFGEFDKIVEASGLSGVEVMRALQWLKNKELLSMSEDVKQIVSLDTNGALYLKDGLPEERFLEAAASSEKVDEIEKIAGLSKEELGVCIGVLKKKAAIDVFKKGDALVVKILPAGERFSEKGFLEESFLKSAEKGLDLASLKDEEKFLLEELKKRKRMVKIDLVKSVKVELTKLGKELANKKLDIDVSDALSSDMLKDGSWKDKTFRSYDVQTQVPKISCGRRHHYRAFLDDVRKRFLSLGFKEMTGPIVESDFWDMDALFMPQFHSARTIHDAYYVKKPAKVKLDEKLVARVKAAHENGFNTGSKGWGYNFDVERTHRTLLRTQGTALSARMLASKNLEIPGRYFGVTRCFRYDVIDATHNVDFYQTEGIVLGEGMNFKHLKGLLKMFAEEFAETDKIKIEPGYFPFTEPSASLFAKHPELGWIELGGSGIFRPELTHALGVDVPVIAWGLGIDRIGMFKLGIKDIRKLFSHDLNFLRSVKQV